MHFTTRVLRTHDFDSRVRQFSQTIEQGNYRDRNINIKPLDRASFYERVKSDAE